jgi:3-methylcrotonyl-CoA carboxylase alpha subunit
MEFAGVRTALRCNSINETDFVVTVGDVSEQASATWSDRELNLNTRRGRFHLLWIDPFAGEIDEAAAARGIVAPMPGTVARILAQPGEQVARGAPLLVLEAMKMEHILRAPTDGHLRALRCAPGDFVQEGTELADFEPDVS